MIALMMVAPVLLRWRVCI